MSWAVISSIHRTSSPVSQTPFHPATTSTIHARTYTHSSCAYGPDTVFSSWFSIYIPHRNSSSVPPLSLCSSSPTRKSRHCLILSIPPAQCAWSEVSTFTCCLLCRWEATGPKSTVFALYCPEKRSLSGSQAVFTSPSPPPLQHCLMFP